MRIIHETKNVRLGIIQARHNAAIPVIPDAACIAMLMTVSARC
ncbi:hypothetical protein [Nocardia tengchongensis]